MSGLWSAHQHRSKRSRSPQSDTSKSTRTGPKTNAQPKALAVVDRDKDITRILSNSVKFCLILSEVPSPSLGGGMRYLSVLLWVIHLK